MNGKVQGIIICGVIAASLAGMLVFLNATDKDKNKKEESSAAESSSAADTAADNSQEDSSREALELPMYPI